MLKSLGCHLLGLTAAVSILFTGLVNAGDLNPSAAPSPTMHTLSEIYDKIDSLSSQEAVIPTTSVFGESSGINATIEGASQGEIQGDCSIVARVDSIVVLGFEQSVEIPTDTTGLPTGTRIHQPMSLIKYIDKSSPLLFQATVTGEQLDVVIKFYRKSESDQEVHYYTIHIEDAMIVEFKSYSPNLEKISFSYKKITLAEEISGLTTEDNWR